MIFNFKIYSISNTKLSSSKQYPNWNLGSKPLINSNLFRKIAEQKWYLRSLFFIWGLLYQLINGLTWLFWDKNDWLLINDNLSKLLINLLLKKSLFGEKQLKTK